MGKLDIDIPTLIPQEVVHLLKRREVHVLVKSAKLLNSDTHLTSNAFGCEPLTTYRLNVPLATIQHVQRLWMQVTELLFADAFLAGKASKRQCCATNTWPTTLGLRFPCAESIPAQPNLARKATDIHGPTAHNTPCVAPRTAEDARIPVTVLFFTDAFDAGHALRCHCSATCPCATIGRVRIC